jgi:hypothetical protein
MHIGYAQTSFSVGLKFNSRGQETVIAVFLRMPDSLRLLITNL